MLATFKQPEHSYNQFTNPPIEFTSEVIKQQPYINITSHIQYQSEVHVKCFYAEVYCKVCKRHLTLKAKQRHIVDLSQIHHCKAASS